MERKRLLVIGEQPQVADWFSRAFAAEFDILSARSGVEAINKAVLLRPHCILLDAKMPKIGDVMLSKVFKMIEQTRSIPILMLCEKPGHEIRRKLQEIGVIDWIEKPLSIEEASEAIHRALRTSLVERRRTPRVKAKIPVIIRVRDDQDQEAEIPSEMEDVSRLGALVSLPVRIRIGQRVEIRRPDPVLGSDHPLSTKARVVWSDDDGDTGFYWHGLEFLYHSAHWVIRQYRQ